jgi:hypothetical protein
MAKENIVQNEEEALLNELIQEQHVTAVQNLDEISGLWPADDDPDELLEYVLNERMGRRQRPSRREPVG